MSTGNEWNFTAGRLQSQWSLGHPSTPKDKGSFLVSHNCSHRALSLWRAVWSLFPSTPHTKGPGAPSPIPKSPFSHPGELSCPSSHLLLATGFGVFCDFFFFQAELHQHHPIALRGSSTQSAFEHLLFDLQNSSQKPLIFTFSEFFFLPFT